MKRSHAEAIGVGVAFGLVGLVLWAVGRTQKPRSPTTLPQAGGAPTTTPTSGSAVPLGTNTELEPSLSSWPLETGRTYRIAGTLRSGATVAQAESALIGAGMGGYVTFIPPLPSDWPPENLPPLSKDEVRYRGEGAWRGTGGLPTAFAFSEDGKTALIIEEVWDYNAAEPVTS